MPIHTIPGDSVAETYKWQLEPWTGFVGNTWVWCPPPGSTAPQTISFTVLHRFQANGGAGKIRVYLGTDTGGGAIFVDGTTHNTDGLYADTITLSPTMVGDDRVQNVGPLGYEVFLITLIPTSGSPGASIVSVTCDMSSGRFDEATYPDFGYPAPQNFDIAGTWVSSGPPMQAQPITVAYLVPLKGNRFATFLLRTATAVTNGSGAFALSFRERAEYLWVMPFYRPYLLSTGDTSYIGTCTSPWVSPGLSGTVKRSDFNIANLSLLDLFGFYSHHSVPISGSYLIGTVTTGYVPKLKIFAQCDNGGTYNVSGATLNVTGLFGSETPTTGADGVATLSSVDPNAITDITVTAGLPVCGSLNTYPPYTDPGGVQNGLFITPGLPQNGIAAYRFHRVPPRCATVHFGKSVLRCTTCGQQPTMRMQTDVYEPLGILACSWINDSNQLRVSINPEAPSGVEAGNGLLGWEPPQTLEAANASDLGMVYLPNGRLYLTYDLSGAKKYRTSDRMGHSNWSAAATPSPAVSRHSSSGRGQRQGFRFRCLSAGGSAWTGAGNIEFSQCRENEGAAWTSPATAVTGARGIFCGGEELGGNGYGVLYRLDADGKVYWKTTDNGESWPGGNGTDVSAMVTWYPVSLARLTSGHLVALLWDAGGSNRLRAARSSDRGLTWEQDTVDIPKIPAMPNPPQLVALSGTVWAVWVAGDQANSVSSVDGGKTWN